MNMKQVMAMALGIAALPAMATLYNVKNVEVTDFADPSNYYLNWNSSNVATVTPNTEDTVYFPIGGTWEFDASSESFKTLARTKLLAFRCAYDKTTRELSNFPTVIINVKEGETATNKVVTIENTTASASYTACFTAAAPDVPALLFRADAEGGYTLLSGACTDSAGYFAFGETPSP